ncbi:MAG TPA: 8-oxo-dGTP diphosphatase [Pseudomonadales bacterium]|nr:8-oxo-dGTP diphosphatase [Pseudomonadales bacterium]
MPRALSTPTPADLPDRLAATVPVRRIAVGEIDAVMALFSARARWMARAGIRQWQPGDADVVRARLVAQARAGGLFGVPDSDTGLRAAVAVATDGPLWQALPPRHRDTAWYLEKLMTRPEPAARGIGGLLLDGVERAAAAVGVGLMRMDCVAASEPLLEFWQTRGYLPLGIATVERGPSLLRHEKRLLPLPIPGLAVPVLAPGIDTAATFADALRATLLFVVRGERILLIHKLRGHGAGRINGPGGKLDPGETPRACALRETREELGIEVRAARFAGELRFQETDGSRIHGFVFRAGAYRGSPTATAEAIPHWCDVDAIPYERMWNDDRMWLPWLLRGRQFRATFLSHGDQVEQARLHLGPVREPD